MSRHSKNNTAHSIFTYGERMKLINQNEWGAIKTRIGSKNNILPLKIADSQRKFEQCFLCLNTLVEPVSCNKGHLFCKSCIVENLLFQKKEIKLKVAEWQEKEKLREKEIKENDNLELLKKKEFLKQSEDDIIQTEKEESMETVSIQYCDLFPFIHYLSIIYP